MVEQLLNEKQLLENFGLMCYMRHKRQVSALTDSAQIACVSGCYGYVQRLRFQCDVHDFLLS